MDRRQFLQSSLAAATLAAAKPSLASAPKKMNVLYVFDDEHRQQSMPGEPFSDPVNAPNIDAFRRANLSMDNCISNYPLCSPYRGIMQTGLWPYQNGITHNWIELGTEFNTLGKVFDKAGYRTIYVGKWHLAGPGFDKQFVPAGPHRQGWQDWHVWGAVDKHMNVSFTFDPNTGEKIHPMGYQATLMADQAVQILHEKKTTDPWIMVVSFHPPHFPVDDAPEEDEAFFASKTPALRPNIKTGDGLKGHVASQESITKFHQGYYAHIRAIDREFARLLKALDDTGQASNTIVVFTSDHGEMAGSHGRMYKNLPFEESARVPFFVRIPGVTHGTKSDALLGSIDIYPTLCGLAGIPVPDHCKGKDLSPIMRGKAGPQNEVVFLMNQGGPAAGAPTGATSANPNGKKGGGGEGGPGPDGGGYAPPNFRGLRSNTHTYAVAHDGKWVLFDNVKDPYQQHNLIDDASLKPMTDRFNGLIADWLKAANDPFDLDAALKLKSSAPA